MCGPPAAWAVFHDRFPSTINQEARSRQGRCEALKSRLGVTAVYTSRGTDPAQPFQRRYRVLGRCFIPASTTCERRSSPRGISFRRPTASTGAARSRRIVSATSMLCGTRLGRANRVKGIVACGSRDRPTLESRLRRKPRRRIDRRVPAGAAPSEHSRTRAGPFTCCIERRSRRCIATCTFSCRTTLAPGSAARAWIDGLLARAS